MKTRIGEDTVKDRGCVGPLPPREDDVYEIAEDELEPVEEIQQASIRPAAVMTPMGIELVIDDQRDVDTLVMKRDQVTSLLREANPHRHATIEFQVVAAE